MLQDLVAVPPPERQESISLPDGRILAWSEWGPPDGVPVLFCTGAAMSGSLGFGAGDLAELAVRLLAIDRPGLGRSDPHPGKTLSTWAEDVRELVRARELGTPLAVGFSQGAPFALALAGRGVVRALALVSAQDQLSHPRVEPLLPPEVAGMVAAVRRDPTGFERGFAQVATPDGLWKLIVEMSGEPDRALYLSPGFGAAFGRALREGFVQGPEGYARDLVLALGPWPVEPERVAAPVDLWFGARDTSTVHSPDLGATLAARLPHATRIVDPEAGGSILWTRSRDILARLLGSGTESPA
ncbi:MAG TPA: alpha/beta hydrolase [Longimicrobiaceae bacterium]|nr:alpha/beta hydrolase [Longimicrobiaceae bacterium]